MAFKAWFTFKHDPPATNAIVLATVEEAEGYADDLMLRWFVPTGYEVRASDEQPNYKWDRESHKLVRLNRQEQIDQIAGRLGNEGGT